MLPNERARLGDRYMKEPVIVIGGGQAGLAAARCLTRRGIDARVLDAAPRGGDAWRQRYDSLVLFTPAQYSGLPDWPIPLPRDAYPTKDQVADYLEDYARHFALPVEHDIRATRLRATRCGFALETSRGPVDAPCVVVATGALQRPVVPECAKRLDAALPSFHSSAYRNAGALPGGRVAVVGAGNSGAQIAEELARTHEVHLCFDALPKRLPQRLLGRDVFWWLKRIGVMDRRPSPGGAQREAVGAIPLIGSKVVRMLRSGAIRRARRVVDAEGRRLRLGDGASLEVDAVVWATGFRNDFSWIEIPGAVRGAEPVIRDGAPPVRGLHFVGMPGSRSKGSAFLGFVGRDAEIVARDVAAEGH